MRSILIQDLNDSDKEHYLGTMIAPRPLCVVSTIDRQGNVSLDNFSFFNLVCIDPPVCMFSPSGELKEHSAKRCLKNLSEVSECVINIINHDMLFQTLLSDFDYPADRNIFKKTGFTELRSELVKPPRIAEALIQMECTGTDSKTIGKTTGGCNLVLAEIKIIHVAERVLDDAGYLDLGKLDLIGRLGDDWYCRITEENLINIPRHKNPMAVGVDAIPASIRNSTVLTGNNIGQLGSVERLPDPGEARELQQEDWFQEILASTKDDEQARQTLLHSKAKELLFEGDVQAAWKVLLAEST